MALLFILHHANGRNRLFAPYPCLSFMLERDRITFLFRQGSGALAFVGNFCLQPTSKFVLKNLTLCTNVIIGLARL